MEQGPMKRTSSAYVAKFIIISFFKLLAICCSSFAMVLWFLFFNYEYYMKFWQKSRESFWFWPAILLLSDYIETLPLANTPEVFGLHPNAEIGYYTQAARDMWSHLVELQPQTGESGAGISREEFIDKVMDFFF